LRKKSSYRCTNGPAADDDHLAVLDQRIARKVVSTVNPRAVDTRNFAALDRPLRIGTDNSSRWYSRNMSEPTHHVAALSTSQHHRRKHGAGWGDNLEQKR